MNTSDGGGPGFVDTERARSKSVVSKVSSGGGVGDATPATGGAAEFPAASEAAGAAPVNGPVAKLARAGAAGEFGELGGGDGAMGGAAETARGSRGGRPMSVRFTRCYQLLRR